MLSGHGLLPFAGLGAKASNQGPTVAKVITVNRATLSSNGEAVLSVLGADAQGESSLTYTWSVTTAPAGGSAAFNLNGSNAAKNDTVTFSEAGSYGLTVRITDGSGLSVTSSTTVAVTSTLVGIQITDAGTHAVLSPKSTLNVTSTSESVLARGFDQFGNLMAFQPAFVWSGTYPSYSTMPKVTSSGNTFTMTFVAAGNYSVTARVYTGGGSSLSGTVHMSVAGRANSVVANPSGTSVEIHGTSTQFTFSKILGPFQNTLGTVAAAAWSPVSLPTGATAPTFSTTGNGSSCTTTVGFAKAGTYVLSVTVNDSKGDSFTESITVVVDQTFTSIAVSPGSAGISPGATQQCTAQALDQFGNPLAAQPQFTWIASAGSISTTGLFTATSTASGSVTVTAASGALSGKTSITITAAGPTNGLGLQDPALAALVSKLDAGGSISRVDMISILTSVGAGGSVSATDLADLKTILADAATLNMADYVRVLAGDVVDGNQANATYQGQTLGNLHAGSTAAQLDDLIDKWFLGTDLPDPHDGETGAMTLTYQNAPGALFSGTPSHNNEYQGDLGDCYFISALGSIADSNPAAIENMIVDNGDGTFTVRFYTSSGTADYVTVNRMLPTYYGSLIYADMGQSPATAGPLWIPLLEKAYVEWAQTGNCGYGSTYNYGAIEGGDPAVVAAQVLGHSVNEYGVGSSTQQAMISGVNNHQAVAIGTMPSSNSNDTLPGGLYGSHAYAVIGYNASTQQFTLYNPWGCDQPNLLTWAQIEQTCVDFMVADTSGSTSMSALSTELRSAPRQGVAPDAASAVFATYGSPAQLPAAVSAQPTARAIDDLLTTGDPIPNVSLGGGLGYWSFLKDAAEGRRTDAQSDAGENLSDLDQDGALRFQTLDDVANEAGELVDWLS
jgi:hypothetical protein